MYKDKEEERAYMRKWRIARGKYASSQ